LFLTDFSLYPFGIFIKEITVLLLNNLDIKLLLIGLIP
jgi:hypothetical protein